VRSVEHYKKDKKRKEILSKTGKVIGTIAFSPFLLLGAIAKYSFAVSDAEKNKGVTIVNIVVNLKKIRVH
jgi:hypothetical protein